jgi:hypothetical protein
MQQGTPSPQINVSKIPGGGGIAGALFAVISMVIFLIGIPALRYFLLAAIVLGCGVAAVIHFIRRETPGRPWIISASEETQTERQDDPQGPPTHLTGIYRPVESPVVS